MEDPLNIQILTQPLAASSVAHDYLRGEGAAGSFYSGDPFALETFRRKLEEVRRRFGREERERAAAALRPVSARARQRLERFVEQGGAMVTTGQQAGFLTGPLYTVHKALTVARLADELEARLGTPIVPVFWTASEDHDWAEVNHAFLPVAGGGVRRVELPGGAHPPLSMSVRELGDGVRDVLAEIGEVVSGEQYGGVLLQWIRDAYRPRRTVADGFSELLARLLEGFDLCLTDAADPHLKRASVPVLLGALRDAEAHERLLRARTQALEAGGYHAQVPVLEGATNVFYHGPAGRERLFRRGGEVVARDSGVAFAVEALDEELATEPGRFSPNVLLRPVVESAVFPTLAYVGGPAEISYFAQICALFPEFGILPPVAYPRASVVLLEPAMQRLMDKLGVELSELRRPRHELVDRLVRREMPEGIRLALERLGGGLAEGYRELIEMAGAIDPTLQRTLGTLRNEAMVRVAESERKIVQQLRRREEVAIGQLDRLRAHLAPEGAPQERVLNVVGFVARYGPELLTEIAAAIRIPLHGEAAPRPALRAEG